MPELPEVDYARRSLVRWLRGGVIASANVLDARILDDGVSSRAAVAALRGRRVVSVARRGKWLRLALDRGLVFSHLGMTGKWVLGDSGTRFAKVTLDVVKGRSKRTVVYVDPRLFGRFVVAEEDIPDWTALGPDPIVDGVDAATLRSRIGRRALPIKALLLDQAFLAGIGNIQATEALWRARISPHTPARDLSDAELRALVRGVDWTLARTMRHEDGPEITYVEEPNAPNPFRIYGREGEPCPRCKTKLSKTIIAGRGSVFCARCQPQAKR